MRSASHREDYDSGAKISECRRVTRKSIDNFYEEYEILTQNQNQTGIKSNGLCDPRQVTFPL